ncbi:hypothetical protein K8942_00695 [Candidatus Peribacteria bacterium]|nr:MAG: hypothetical protein K8942_00695 [Candidatus Peribacteria bacterium]
MSTQTHSSHEESVSALLNHETAERNRIEQAEAKNAQEMSALHDMQHEEKKKLEQDERAKAQAELQSFMDEELSKIGEASAAARAEALNHVESHAKKALPKALNTLLDKAVSGALIQ